MSRIIAALTILALTACASPTPQETRLGDADDGKNWCQRNPGACLPLFPLAIADWLIGSAIQAAPAAIIDTIENTSVQSDRIRTPNGTYDVNSVCSFGSCDTTVRKR